MSDSGTERRAYKRFAMPCPSQVANPDAAESVKGKALNVSDGGMFLAMPVRDLPPQDTTVRVRFSVPRSTPNTYMLEDFACKAQVVRHEALTDDSLAGVALKSSLSVVTRLTASCSNLPPSFTT